MILNGLYALAWAAVILGAVVLIPRAIAHDLRMAAIWNMDDEELTAALEADPDLIKRAKQW